MSTTSISVPNSQRSTPDHTKWEIKKVNDIGHSRRRGRANSNLQYANPVNLAPLVKGGWSRRVSTVKVPSDLGRQHLLEGLDPSRAKGTYQMQVTGSRAKIVAALVSGCRRACRRPTAGRPRRRHRVDRRVQRSARAATGPAFGHDPGRVARSRTAPTHLC